MKLEVEVGEETSMAGQHQWMRYDWACGRLVLDLLAWQLFIGGAGTVDYLFSKATWLTEFFLK